MGRLAVAAEADLFGHCDAALGIGRCRNRVGVLQVPAGAVLTARKTVLGGEVAAEHLAAPPAVEADHKVSAEGSVDRDRRFARGNFSGRVEPGKGSMNGGDEV